MAYSITCPSCAAKLKSATAIPVGRTIQCPKCTEKFAVGADNMVELSDSRVMTPNPQSKPSTSSAKVAPLPKKTNDGPPSSKSGSRPAARSRDDDEDRGQRRKPRDEAEARPRRRPNDDDEEERPRKKNVDDDEEQPRARKRRDQDDEEREERPRKKRGDEDEEEDRPRARKRRDEDDDEEDDRPRSRKGRDEDEDDRPRRNRDDEDEDDDRPRKKNKKKKGNLGLKIGIGVGAVAVLGLIVGLIIWLVGGSSVDAEMLSLMPADTVKIEFANVEKIVAADSKFKKMSEKSEDGKFGILKSAGLKIDDVKSVIDGRTEKDENVQAIRLKKSADKGKFTSGGSEQKAGDKAYWKIKGDAIGAMFISFPADDLIVWTRKEDLIKSILARSLGDLVISTELQNLMKKVSGGDVWQAKTAKAAANANVQVQISGIQVSKIKGAAMRTEFSGTQLTLKTYLVLDSGDEVNKIVKEYEKGIEKMKKEIESDKKDKNDKLTDAQKDALKKMASSISFSADGATLERSASIDIGPFNDNEIFGPMLMIYLMVGSGCE
jgi:hypothetical protein